MVLAYRLAALQSRGSQIDGVKHMAEPNNIATGSISRRDMILHDGCVECINRAAVEDMIFSSSTENPRVEGKN